MNSIIVKDQKNKTYALCGSKGPSVDSCYEISSNASKFEGYGALIIHGIQSTDKIYITYDATLTSSITIEDCRNGHACNEEFINQSLVSDFQYCTSASANSVTTITCTPPETSVSPQCQDVTYYDVSGKAIVTNPCNSYTITSNVTTAEGVCQYFLTRASGDVFLEDQLTYGIDVSKCYPFKNVSSTIVTPAKPIEGHLIKTGTSEVVSIGHEICSAGQSNFDEKTFNKLSKETKDSLKNLFGAGLTTLSSQICEVGLVPGSDWDKATISAAIAKNIGKLTRWASLIPPTKDISDFQTLLTNAPGGVYYYDGNGNDTVIIGSTGILGSTGLDIPEGSGPITIIVKNADLQINGNISYKAGTPATDPRQISSLGVIVLDGNMFIDPKVEKLSGAYFVQRSDPSDLSKGNILSGTKDSRSQNSDLPLTVYGSIYGNIGPLFDKRTGSGDIAQDQGAITIRYDQRIIQNPPQGLAEILGNFSQSQVAQ